MTRKFKKIVFVSNDAMEEITKHYAGLLDKSFVCNNLINAEQIRKLSNEKIDEEKVKDTTFVNVSRHDEHSKRIFRILNASKKLYKEGYKFNVIFVGDGVNHNDYIHYVNSNNLNEIIKFVGSKKNPYPYYKMADATILSSNYEGYPVVFLESMVLNKPIISTKVSDYKDLVGKYGIFVENNDTAIYDGMKKFLNDGFIINEKFDVKKYNEKIQKEIEAIINN